MPEHAPVISLRQGHLLRSPRVFYLASIAATRQRFAAMNLPGNSIRKLALMPAIVQAACLGSPAKDPAHMLLDFSRATVVVRSGKIAPAEETAARVLVDEVKKRTGLNWTITTVWPAHGGVIALTSGETVPGWPGTMPKREGANLAELRPEGFRLVADGTRKENPVVWIRGADSRGALFGVGQFLRSLEWGRHSARISAELDVATAPAQAIRGHQLGYRETANSYDGWDEKQFEQYIRELALFGANSIEGIPFHDDRKSPHMPLPREIMNRKLSEICARYELDYWIWTPADFDLKNAARRAEFLEKHEALFRDCPRLNGVFFPGGDPGNNPPELVMPYLEDLAGILAKYHPKAKIWLSMQSFGKAKVDFVHNWINEKMPDWLGGLVGGPSSPPLAETRARLPKRYGLRDYPDITHTIRSQYEAAWWDPAFAFTLGRESANPRPAFFKLIQNYLGPYTTGFISYSDGAHDDVNKAIWSRLSWEPQAEPRDILVEYTRFFFNPAIAERAADSLLALEKNWDGPLAGNGGVDATFAVWHQLEQEWPGLRENWRWQLCLLRAYYDVYTRHRLLNETELERRANENLNSAPTHGADQAMDSALTVLQRARLKPIKKEWRARIGQLCQELFQSIKLQTSVPLYKAAGYERGAILDFVDHPLNNRWWLEDEFNRIRKLPSETDKLKALELIRTWENPGPGSFYDEVGNVAKSLHVMHGEGLNTDPLMEKNPSPTFWWWEEGSSRKRLSWQTSMDWPLGLKYQNLDPQASYRVRLTGYGEARLRCNGQLLMSSRYGKGIGEFKEFSVPSDLIKEGSVILTFDPLPEEAHLNWRQQSRVSEVWLLKE